MRYVIAYDLADDGRRERVSRILAGWGDRVQYSVFEVTCQPTELAELVDSVDALIVPPADRLRIYRLCAACAEATHLVGGRPLSEGPVAWIV